MKPLLFMVRSKDFAYNFFLVFGFYLIFGYFLIRKNNIIGICTSQDVDIFIRHMNNARYLRELDFARFHFYGLNGLYEGVRKHKGTIF